MEGLIRRCSSRRCLLTTGKNHRLFSLIH